MVSEQEWDPCLPLSEYLQLLSRGGWGTGFSGFGDLLYPPISGKWRKPNISGLGICRTLFQLFMQTFVLADHKLLDHPQMYVPEFALNLFAQHSPWAGGFIPPPPSSATHTFSSCCHSLGEDSSTAEAPLPLCLHHFILIDITVTVSDNKPWEHPPSNSQAGSATHGLSQTLTEL